MYNPCELTMAFVDCSKVCFTKRFVKDKRTMTGPHLKLDQTEFLWVLWRSAAQHASLYSVSLLVFELVSGSQLPQPSFLPFMAYASSSCLLPSRNPRQASCFLRRYCLIEQTSAGFLIGPLVLSGLAPTTTMLDVVLKIHIPPLKAQVDQVTWDLTLLARRRHMFTFVLLIVYSLST